MLRSIYDPGRVGTVNSYRGFFGPEVHRFPV